MTTIESLRMDGNAGALQALDAAELSAVTGGQGPLADFFNNPSAAIWCFLHPGKFWV
jgi:hypothetical protein